MENLKTAILEVLNRNSDTIYGKGSCGELGDSSQGIDSYLFTEVTEEIISIINSCTDPENQPNQYGVDLLKNKLVTTENEFNSIDKIMNATEFIRSKKRLEEIFDKTISDYNKRVSHVYAFKFTDSERKMLLEMIQDYAREVAQASLEKAAENVKTSDNCKVWNCEGQSVNIETIVNLDNIVLL